MREVADAVDEVARERSFAGVVRVDRGDEVVLAGAYGLAERGFAVANTVDTRFGLASGTKGLTALVVVSLIEGGALALSTTARSVLGKDLPLIADDVTVEHLLAHRSGIGDYVDEETDLDLDDYLLPVPVSELASTEAYITVLDGHPAKFAPGERFAYCNSGYVVLALVAERASGRSFPDLVRERVCAPAGMTATAFLRSDELPGDAARGYLAQEGLRTNVLHLPVQGSGDGGIYATVGDVHALWRALEAARIVSAEWVETMLHPRSDPSSQPRRYGLGFWLHPSRDAVILEGGDTGVSFRSVRDRAADLTYTVLSNTTDGAWPIARHLDDVLT